MFCQNCGAELREGALFCTKCGTKAEPPKKVGEQAVETPAAIPVAEPVPVAQPEPAPAAEPAAEPMDWAQPQPAVQPDPAAQPMDWAQPAPMAQPIPDYALPPVQDMRPSMPVKPAKSSAKKGSNALSALFCVLFFITAFIALVLGVVRVVLTEDHIRQSLDRVELSEIELINAADGETMTVAEYFYRITDDEKIEEYEITQEDVDAIVEDLEWKDVAADILSRYANCYLNGDSFNIDASDVYDIFDDNKKLIEKEANGFVLDKKATEERIDNELISKIDPSAIDLSGVLSFAFSMLTLIIVSVLAVIFALLALVMTRFDIKAWLSGVGMSSIVLGGLVLLASAVLALLSSLLGNMIFSAVVMPNLLTLLIFGLAFFAVGMVMYVLPKLIGKKN